MSVSIILEQTKTNKCFVLVFVFVLAHEKAFHDGLDPIINWGRYSKIQLIVVGIQKFPILFFKSDLKTWPKHRVWFRVWVECCDWMFEKRNYTKRTIHTSWCQYVIIISEVCFKKQEKPGFTNYWPRGLANRAWNFYMFQK